MPQLHIIGPNAFARGVLYRAAENAGDLPVGIVDAQWLALHDWGFGADVVILRAQMYDVWPVLVKVRALVALDCGVLVLIEHPTPAQCARLYEAGAWAVLRTDHDPSPEHVIALAKDALRTIEDAGGAEHTGPARGGTRRNLPFSRESAVPQEPFTPLFPLSVISDRVLQISGLYVSAASPHARDVAGVLGVSESTVKGHLARIRSAYRREGVRVSSRAALRERMIADGLLIGEMGW